MTNNYQAVLEKARREFAEKNCLEMARFSGAGLSLYAPLSWREFTVPLLGRLYRVLWPTGEVFQYGTNKEASLPTSILLLHYLSQSKGSPAHGRWIPFNQLWGGSSFFNAYRKRALEPLADFFRKAARPLPAAAGAPPQRPPGQGAGNLPVHSPAPPAPPGPPGLRRRGGPFPGDHPLRRRGQRIPAHGRPGGPGGAVHRPHAALGPGADRQKQSIKVKIGQNNLRKPGPAGQSGGPGCRRQGNIGITHDKHGRRPSPMGRSETAAPGDRHRQRLNCI